MSGMQGLGGADLDDAVRDFIARTGEAHARHAGGRALTPVEARQVAEQVRTPWRAGGPAMHRTTEAHAPSPHGPVRLRIHDPSPGRGKPILIYVHGGGWMLFSLETHDRLMREYAARAGAVVVGVDYALSPEAKFPLALEQCMAAVRWAGGGGVGEAGDVSRLAMGGDSVGGNMSLASAVALRDAGEGHILKALMLHYGAFDTEIDAEHRARFGGEGYMLTPEEMDVYWAAYLTDPQERTNPLATPARADLAGLPPVFLTIPSCDVLTGQSLALADRLAAAGVEVRAEVYQGASHSFLEAVSISALADRALQDGADWLAATLAPAP
ncbi:alpha/beta hydrolase fold domain-containing protein [Phenylobacterium sp.]|uniref:alpha/beta hydrolase fold domain-containing protein n=1 Tax=Phenylobacterium sp. TaxID=1871053 RepID=UPI00273176A0|nr:alpha/beta hydrolase fold domain-containing protein [Phenylobacterium sp.]MDP1618672.1 alpha/beta hydrolase fold domain-containing protein [Phenylobacterium sp.]MDP1986577.1 alpha/beta hydrolase fold domain-containing protein [Phenylobacterium sp.]